MLYVAYFARYGLKKIWAMSHKDAMRGAVLNAGCQPVWIRRVPSCDAEIVGRLAKMGWRGNALALADACEEFHRETA